MVIYTVGARIKLFLVRKFLVLILGALIIRFLRRFHRTVSFLQSETNNRSARIWDIAQYKTTILQKLWACSGIDLSDKIDYFLKPFSPTFSLTLDFTFVASVLSHPRFVLFCLCCTFDSFRSRVVHIAGHLLLWFTFPCIVVPVLS